MVKCKRVELSLELGTSCLRMFKVSHSVESYELKVYRAFYVSVPKSKVRSYSFFAFRPQTPNFRRLFAFGLTENPFLHPD